jgi:hypothetical protein
MNRAVRQRVLATAVVAIALSAVAASSASAAVIAPAAPCLRYVPTLSSGQWVPISGSGFTPNTNPAFNSVELNYTTGDLGGYTPLAADGSFNVGVFMPTEFISSDTGRTKTYTLTATDRETPGLVAQTNVTFVRVGAAIKPSRVRRNLDRKVRWSQWGAPTGAKIYLHWTFKGRRYALRRLGTSKGACGITHKKLPFLPVRARTGTWKVYYTTRKKLNRKKALFRMDLNVFRSFSSSAATVSAARVVR